MEKRKQKADDTFMNRLGVSECEAKERQKKEIGRGEEGARWHALHHGFEAGQIKLETPLLISLLRS